MLQDCHLRIARPTDQLETVVDFYVKVLGFEKLGQFRDHDGFDGCMVGHSDAPYHLEFTQNPQHQAGSAPSKDHLLVFYIAMTEEWETVIQSIERSGVRSVESLNPYWEQFGKTYEDPDGYRIVIQNGVWPSIKSV